MALKIIELTLAKRLKQCLSHYQYYMSVFNPCKAMYVFSDPAVRRQRAKVTWIQVCISRKSKAQLTNVPGMWKHKPNQVAGSPDHWLLPQAAFSANEHGVGLDQTGQEPERFLSGANFFQTLEQLGPSPSTFKIKAIQSRASHAHRCRIMTSDGLIVWPSCARQQVSSGTFSPGGSCVTKQVQPVLEQFGEDGSSSLRCLKSCDHLAGRNLRSVLPPVLHG